VVELPADDGRSEAVGSGLYWFQFLSGWTSLVPGTLAVRFLNGRVPTAEHFRRPSAITPVKRYDPIGSAPTREIRAGMRFGPGHFRLGRLSLNEAALTADAASMGIELTGRLRKRAVCHCDGCCIDLVAARTAALGGWEG
jgi:hypothetical protein